MMPDPSREEIDEQDEQNQQQVMDHKRFESLYIQNVDILRLITEIQVDLKAINAARKQDKSFLAVSAILIVALIIACFISIATMIGFTH